MRNFGSLPRVVSSSLKTLVSCVCRFMAFTSFPAWSMPQAMSCSTSPIPAESLSSWSRPKICLTRKRCRSRRSIASRCSGDARSMFKRSDVLIWLASRTSHCLLTASTFMSSTCWTPSRCMCFVSSQSASASERRCSRGSPCAPSACPPFVGPRTTSRSASSTSPSRRSYIAASYVYSWTRAAAMSTDLSTISSWQGTWSLLAGPRPVASSCCTLAATSLHKSERAWRMLGAVVRRQRHTSARRRTMASTRVWSGTGNNAGRADGMSRWKPRSWIATKLRGTSTSDFTRGARCVPSASLVRSSVTSAPVKARWTWRCWGEFAVLKSERTCSTFEASGLRR
mmetsp:Transcript_101725/g.287971  ORF Transcript_101725/g.287971 Transcript_101725/m.287971 type:complete len:340 (+) Transcript_101725:381-1400(+)